MCFKDVNSWPKFSKCWPDFSYFKDVNCWRDFSYFKDVNSWHKFSKCWPAFSYFKDVNCLCDFLYFNNVNFWSDYSYFEDINCCFCIYLIGTSVVIPCGSGSHIAGHINSANTRSAHTARTSDISTLPDLASAWYT